MYSREKEATVARKRKEVEVTETVETDAEVKVDESKYAGMPRNKGAAMRRLDVAEQKLANLNTRLQKAEEKHNKIKDTINEKRPALVETIARAKVQLAAIDREDEAVAAELAKLNAPEADADESDEPTEYADDLNAAYPESDDNA